MYPQVLFRPCSVAWTSCGFYGCVSATRSSRVILGLQNFRAHTISPYVYTPSKSKTTYTRGIHLSSRHGLGKPSTRGCIRLGSGLPNRMASPTRIQFRNLSFLTDVLSGIHPAILSPLVFAGLVATLWAYKVCQLGHSSSYSSVKYSLHNSVLLFADIHMM